MAPFASSVLKENSLTSRDGLLGFARALLAEFLGTLLFVLIATGEYGQAVTGHVHLLHLNFFTSGAGKQSVEVKDWPLGARQAQRQPCSLTPSSLVITAEVQWLPPACSYCHEWLPYC